MSRTRPAPGTIPLRLTCDVQLVASRYEQASIRWGEVFGDAVVAVAMIDRLVHHAGVLTLAGDSFRTRARRELLAKHRDKKSKPPRRGSIPNRPGG